MKRLLAFFLGISLVFSAGLANATSFTLESIGVSLNTSDPGLVLYWNQVQTTPVTFNLNNVGDSVTAALFTIGTSETWSNSDDLNPKPITATFTFSDPSVTAVDTGSTQGNLWLGFLSYGTVSWNDPVYYSFGTTGQFSIDLSNVWFTTPGSAVVYGTMTLTRADSAAPVPEPSTMLLLGSGLLGLMGFRKRFRR